MIHSVSVFKERLSKYSICAHSIRVPIKTVCIVDILLRRLRSCIVLLVTPNFIESLMPDRPIYTVHMSVASPLVIKETLLNAFGALPVKLLSIRTFACFLRYSDSVHFLLVATLT